MDGRKSRLDGAPPLRLQTRVSGVAAKRLAYEYVLTLFHRLPPVFHRLVLVCTCRLARVRDSAQQARRVLIILVKKIEGGLGEKSIFVGRSFARAVLPEHGKE